MTSQISFSLAVFGDKYDPRCSAFSWLWLVGEREVALMGTEVFHKLNMIFSWEDWEGSNQKQTGIKDILDF